MSEKTWTDQPDEVTTATKLGSFTLEAHDNRRDSMRGQVEIRRKPNISTTSGEPYGNAPWLYYVTAGNLFGSQTIKCTSADVVLNVLCNMGHNVALPKGAELLESKK